jgi:hypothetical protein
MRDAELNRHHHTSMCRRSMQNFPSSFVKTITKVQRPKISWHKRKSKTRFKLLTSDCKKNVDLEKTNTWKHLYVYMLRFFFFLYCIFEQRSEKSWKSSLKKLSIVLLWALFLYTYLLFEKGNFLCLVVVQYLLSLQSYFNVRVNRFFLTMKSKCVEFETEGEESISRFVFFFMFSLPAFDSDLFYWQQNLDGICTTSCHNTVIIIIPKKKSDIKQQQTLFSVLLLWWIFFVAGIEVFQRAKNNVNKKRKAKEKIYKKYKDQPLSPTILHSLKK